MRPAPDSIWLWIPRSSPEAHIAVPSLCRNGHVPVFLPRNDVRLIGARVLHDVHVVIDDDACLQGLFLDFHSVASQCLQSSKCPSLVLIWGKSHTGPLSNKSALLWAAMSRSTSNVNDAATAPNRCFMLIAPSVVCGVVNTDRSVRPRVAGALVPRRNRTCTPSSPPEKSRCA